MRFSLRLPVLLGSSGKRQVILGSAPAGLLHSLSFADVLNEATGRGYQRKFNPRHSLDFKKYLDNRGSTTIPLTFNLRRPKKGEWVFEQQNGTTFLRIHSDTPVFSQVDCQHRLGSLATSKIPLAFMSFVGLSVRQETEIFTTINGKAKGLNTSLLDYNLARLAKDLAIEDPHLFIALRLNSEEDSPWHGQLGLGGNMTSGMKRRASLRTIQKAVAKFLRATNIITIGDTQEASRVVLDFWKAVAVVLEHQWNCPRKYYVTKGIGVYALMLVAADLYLDAVSQNINPSVGYFSSCLFDFVTELDWSNHGPLEGLSGESGANKLYKELSHLRLKAAEREPNA
jgi:DNA sulfur modification protein DndB